MDNVEKQSLAPTFFAYACSMIGLNKFKTHLRYKFTSVQRQKKINWLLFVIYWNLSSGTNFKKKKIDENYGKKRAQNHFTLHNTKSGSPVYIFSCAKRKIVFVYYYFFLLLICSDSVLTLNFRRSHRFNECRSTKFKFEMILKCLCSFFRSSCCVLPPVYCARAIDHSLSICIAS